MRLDKIAAMFTKSKLLERITNFPQKIILLSIVVFLILNLYTLGAVPYLDGNIEFVESYDLYSGGVNNWFNNWQTVHPPLKYFLSSLLHKISGVNTLSHTLIGTVFGVVGIIFVYLTGRKVFNKTSANFSAFFVATSGMYLSVGMFSLKDYLVAIFVVAAIYFYISNRYFYSILCSSFAVLTKETAIILPISILVCEVLFAISKSYLSLKLRIKSLLSENKNSVITLIVHLRNKKFINLGKKLTLLTIPLIVNLLWFTYLKYMGKEVWSDWNFSSTADRGSVYTVVNNLLTLEFLNEYAYQNWLQLLLLNFNWLYWLLIIVFLFITLRKRKKIMSKDAVKIKFFVTASIFFVIYFITVLSFQTYTIPRYALPLIMLMFVFAGFALGKLWLFLPTFRLFMITALSVLIFASLFSSSDPVSSTIWGKTEVLGQEIYALNEKLSGNDGITYNYQYNILVKKRSDTIRNFSFYATPALVDCRWFFADIRNDSKTFSILGLAPVDLYRCAR
jgi:hypothetical protein